MADKNKKVRKRVAFDFTPEGYEALTALMELSGHKTPGELMRRALKILSKLEEWKSKGYELAYVKEEKVIYVELL